MLDQFSVLAIALVPRMSISVVILLFLLKITKISSKQQWVRMNPFRGLITKTYVWITLLYLMSCTNSEMNL
jgi:hypothetical protein